MEKAKKRQIHFVGQQLKLGHPERESKRNLLSTVPLNRMINKK